MRLRHLPWLALAAVAALLALPQTANAQFDLTTPPLEVPVRWCVLEGTAPTLIDPGLVEENSTKAILLRRLARVTNNIYLPQANVIFRSGLPAPDPGGIVAAPSVFPVSPQPIDATQALNLSAGVSNSNVLRGRSFSCRATLFRSAWAAR